jgi:hypothetical protein
MTKTPETDGAERMAFSQEYMVPTKFARKLERERDEAIRQLNNIKATDIHTCHDQCQRPMCVLRRERDEAREKIERQRERIAYLEGATHHACGTPLSKAIKERDDARLELKGCKAKNKRIFAELLVKITDIERERDEWAKLCGQYKQERDEARARK